MSKITIFKSNNSIAGLQFTYRDGHVDLIKGSHYTTAADGPANPFDIDLSENDIVVGVTVESCDKVPRRLGFTILRLN